MFSFISIINFALKECVAKNFYEYKSILYTAKYKFSYSNFTITNDTSEGNELLVDSCVRTQGFDFFSFPVYSTGDSYPRVIQDVFLFYVSNGAEVFAVISPTRQSNMN